jgi:uncharacterized membrane protein (TIGR01218 family)
MVDMDVEYKISDVKWINVRYYLIKIGDKSYILDFANPKDLRQYFFMYFPKCCSEFNIYDVSGDEKKYDAKPLPFFRSDASGPITSFIIKSYIVHIFLFPRFLNILYLTKDRRIVEHWGVTLFVIFFVIFVIFLLLYFSRTKIDLPTQSSFLVPLEDVKIRPSDRRVILYIALPVVIFFSVFWGISISSYVHLLVGGILFPSAILFMRFGGVPSMTRKFHIIEKEELMNGKE